MLLQKAICIEFQHINLDQQSPNYGLQTNFNQPAAPIGY